MNDFSTPFYAMMLRQCYDEIVFLLHIHAVNLRRNRTNTRINI
jgi:hypothetical protein